MEYKKHDFGLTQTNKTIVTVIYIVLGSPKFSENVMFGRLYYRSHTTCGTKNYCRGNFIT